MLALIGSIAGFITSFIPEIFNFIKDKKDKSHELELIKLQIEVSRYSSSTKLEEVQIKNDLNESKILYNDTKPIKISWVDAFAASVRPMITYSFFVLYICIKLMIFLNYDKGISMPIWTDEDQAIFCAVIGFWFGHRAFGKSRMNINNGY